MHKRIGIARVIGPTRVEFSNQVSHRIDSCNLTIKPGDVVEVLYGRCETTSDHRYLGVLRVIAPPQSPFTCLNCGEGFIWEEAAVWGWITNPQRCPSCMCYNCFMVLDGGMERRSGGRVRHECSNT